MTDGPPRTAKGDRRRVQIARAAADLVREEGPAALSHRAVARRAGASLSATTYYYSGLDDLAAAAGATLVDDWVAHADAVLHRVRARRAAPEAAGVLVEAVLPPGDDSAVRAHYEQLLAAGRVPALADALGAGRARLDAVLAELLAALGRAGDAPDGAVGAVLADPALVLAVIDGAVVAAVSEGRPVRDTARALLAVLLEPVPRGPAPPPTTSGGHRT